jgi:ElaB/YqjD/DUF883 family membrane-anchored ribosome-binding protein
MDPKKAADTARDAIDNGADSAEEFIDETARKASDATQRARSMAHDAVDDGQDALEGAIRCAKGMIRTHPLASVAIVGAIAYLWGRMR